MMHQSDQNELNSAIEQVLATTVTLHESGRLEEAEQLYRSMLELLPLHGHANYFLGLLLAQRKRRGEALPFLRTAVTASPHTPAFWCTYLEVLLASNEIQLALQALTVAREMKIDGAEIDAIEQRIQTAQGLTSSSKKLKMQAPLKVMKNIERLFKAGKFRPMEAAARKALDQYPNDGYVWKSISVALTTLKRDHEAYQATRRAAELLPHDPDALRNLGLLLERYGNMAEAEIWLRKGLDLDPKHIESLIRLGHILHTREDYDGAEPLFRRAVELAPNDFRAHALFAECLRMQGRHAETEHHHLASLAIRDTLGIRSARLFHLSEAGTMDSQALYEEHVAYGTRARSQIGPARTAFDNTRSTEKRLRIGFVSGDLHAHAVAHYLEPIIAEMKRRDDIDTYAYSNHQARDNITARLRESFTHWRDLYDLSDDAAEQRILEDKIDILFDLSSHTNYNRLELFVRRVAPVQVAWLGYPSTTGVDTIDYFITDVKMIPPGTFDDIFVEKIVRLNGNVAFLPHKASPPVNALPALDNGYVTFASFNRSHKLGRPVIAAWSEILRRAPRSRMVLGAMSGEHIRQRLVQWFQEEGIDTNRLSFLDRDKPEIYLKQHHQVDLCLDAFPYTGATTSLHALWMGVPTVTFNGTTPASRAGAAIVAHVGLDDFVGESVEDFIERAVKISEDIPRLSEIRQSLRERFNASPWGRPALVAANIDRACQLMWAQYCNGATPAPIMV